MSRKKKNDIVKLDSDFSFEELVSHIANVKAEDVDEAMKAESQDEETVQEEDCEPPQEC